MTDERWILAADEWGGRLIRIRRAGPEQLRVAIEDDIHYAWEAQGHGRASKENAPPDATSAEDEARRDRFAREIAVWLEQQAERRRIERIAVFAPRRFLGTLREAWSSRLALRVDEHDGDLSKLTAGDLERHDAINELVKDGRI